jgi:hypothetical protein
VTSIGDKFWHGYPSHATPDKTRKPWHLFPTVPHFRFFSTVFGMKSSDTGCLRHCVTTQRSRKNQNQQSLFLLVIAHNSHKRNSHKTMNTSSIKRLVGLATGLLLISFSLSEVNAYAQKTLLAFKPQTAKTPTALSAWSIPPEGFSTPMFLTPSFGKSWYSEVNPTARRTVYDEWVRNDRLHSLLASTLDWHLIPSFFFYSTPLDYTFVSPGDDWPSSYDSPRENQPKPTTRRRIDPLRRAANWVRGRKNQPE